MNERPDLFVIGRVLEALEPEPLRRTQLQQRARLNYTVFQRYLDLLLRLGLVAAAPGDDGHLVLTARGEDARRFIAEGMARIFGPDRASARV